MMEVSIYDQSIKQESSKNFCNISGSYSNTEDAKTHNLDKGNSALTTTSDYAKDDVMPKIHLYFVIPTKVEIH